MDEVRSSAALDIAHNTSIVAQGIDGFYRAFPNAYRQVIWKPDRSAVAVIDSEEAGVRVTIHELRPIDATTTRVVVTVMLRGDNLIGLLAPPMSRDDARRFYEQSLGRLAQNHLRTVSMAADRAARGTSGPGSSGLAA
jgi:hypothetical protein